MLKNIVKTSLLALGTFTAIAYAPSFIADFVAGFKAGVRGDDVEAAVLARRFSS